ncbi:MAG TPA: DNA polymerase III subunit epsilon [Steroidobacteraceae bacterium]|nr:DNA polymerase III subunit epsilon [Steroidobacteraceae bacterium]
MRQVVFDTETTGLDPAQGHCIIEVGAIEVINRRKTGRTFHRYCKPDREVEAGALAVHGITNEFLSTQPRFADLAGELIDFISGAELVIHNAAFDVAFVNAELKRINSPHSVESLCTVLDTLPMAREKYPGQRNSLDALCKRLGVDNSAREYHGALLDAQLLLDVYLAMTGGQSTMLLDHATHAGAAVAASRTWQRPAGALNVLCANEEELAQHEKILGTLDKASNGKTLWRKTS